MSLEITDRDEFTDKFTHLMVATDNLRKAGMAPPRELVAHMVEEFLDQFTATTPAPAPRYKAGWVIIQPLTGLISSDFAGHLYGTQSEAQSVLTIFLDQRPYLGEANYDVVEAFHYA